MLWFGYGPPLFEVLSVWPSPKSQKYVGDKYTVIGTPSMTTDVLKVGGVVVQKLTGTCTNAPLAGW